MYKFSKDFTKHRKKAKRAVVFRGKPFPWKTRLFQTHIEEFSQYVQNFRLATQFFRTTSGIPYWDLWKYHVVSSQFQKITNEIPKSSRLGCFLANNFALLHAEDETCGPFNRRGTADLPLLGTLLAICQKLREPSFWEVMQVWQLQELFSNNY